MNKKTFVVGIGGGSASGKTTISKILTQKLEGASVKSIHMDSYFKKPEDRPVSTAPIVGKEYMDDNHPLTMELDRLSKDLSNAIASETYDVIIVEGLLTLWDEAILDQLDLKLFVDCRADERIVRRIKRNMRWGQTFEQITDVYLDLVRYRHDEFVEPTRWRADFVINGSTNSELALEIIEKYIREKIGQKYMYASE